MLTSSSMIALWLLASAPTPASGPSIAVAPVAPVGEAASAASLSRLDEAVREGLARGELEIEVLTGDCQDRACWVERARAQDLTHMLLPRIERRGPDDHFGIDVIDVTTGDVVASTDNVCEICGEDELLATTADFAAELIPRLRRLDAQPARVVVEGGPVGATVELDGRVVGKLPWEGEVGPGEHVLELSLDGYQPLRRRFTTSAGVEERLKVELRLAPEIEQTDPSRRRRVLLATGASLVAVGGVGVGVGTGLFVLDGRPYRTDCPADVVDINGRCPQMYEATAPAAVAVAVGGAALVAGVAVLAYALRRRGNGAPSADVGLRPARRGLALAIRF